MWIVAHITDPSFVLLHQRLADDADFFRKARSPQDAACYEMPILLSDESNWHVYRFLVNDTSEPGTMMVEAFTYETRPKS